MPPEPNVRPELLVRVHGCCTPAIVAFGGDNVRERYVRAARPHLANTSCSVIVRDQVSGAMLLHLLIDAGVGVVNALIAGAATFGEQRLDGVLLTHPHYDHIAELPELAQGIVWTRRAARDRDYLLPVYCTDPCARQSIAEGGTFGFMSGATRFAMVSHRPVVPCEPVTFDLAGGETLTVTPVSVWHGPSAPGAVIYVVQALGKKVIFAWDLLQILEEPERPSEMQQAAGVSALPRRHAELVHDADVLFLDSTTWNPAPVLGHMSILEGLALARRWRPRRTYWIHYGANERPGESPLNPTVELPDIDVTRALTDPELHWLAGRVSATFAVDVRVAYTGLTLGMIDAWPEAHPARFG